MTPSEWLLKRTDELKKHPPYNESMMGAIPAHLQALREFLDACAPGFRMPPVAVPYLRAEDLAPPPAAEQPALVGPTGPEIPDLPAAPGANGPVGPTAPYDAHSVSALLRCARGIWGPESLAVRDVVVRLGVDFGKLARLARGATKDIRSAAEHTAELEAAFGNIIFSMIRWADSVGLDVHRCIARAIETQEKFARANPER